MRFYLLNITGAAVMAAGLVEGTARLPFTQDQTYLTWLIAALFLAGLGFASQGHWTRCAWIQRRLVLLGLIGTVVGFIIALSGVDASEVANVEAITPMAAKLIEGMQTALYTTLVGSVSAFWLSLNGFLLAGRDD